jgi:molecular chaperone DnaK (HSP70)
MFPIVQWVAFGEHDRRNLLPSFRYEFTQDEQHAIGCGEAEQRMRLPWEKQSATTCVGVMARDAGMRSPGRRIASAKSWLCHDGVDRTANLLPWHSDPDVAKISPVSAAASYLEHLRRAWDDDHQHDPLAQQDVTITLPASFDEVARELTVAAAKEAGLPRIHLIEEPQAAFYAWLDRHCRDWESRVHPGQLILVCDIGGGTTDFTLIRVRIAEATEKSEASRAAAKVAGRSPRVQFHRVAVGKHLILGGDNLDLALAKFVEAKLGQGTLSPRIWDRLLQQARLAKETLLGDQPPEQYTINLPAEGTRLIGGSRQVTVERKEVESLLIDGFFPIVELQSRPRLGQSGFQEFGLPYAADPRVTSHLAAFLYAHARAGLEQNEVGDSRPQIVLFNGGTLASAQIRHRIVEVLSQWFSSPQETWSPEVLEHDRLDIAVAQGAAYFGMVRRGEGIHIAANLGRSYYMQVQDQPARAVCLIPGKAQPGEKYALREIPLQLQVGCPVQFPLWVSSTRLTDAAGTLVDIQREDHSPLPPICSALLRGKSRSEQALDVNLETELSEIGTLGLFAVETQGRYRWQLQFDIRSTLETDREAHRGAGETAGVVDEDSIEACARTIADTFVGTQKPGQLAKQLQNVTELSRAQWPPTLLRGIWQSLMQHAEGRRRSPEHEARWMNLVGYALRPGYGVAVDDWRVGQTWRSVFGQLAFGVPSSRTESLILWRRIAGGLSAGQQQQLATSCLSPLIGSTAKSLPLQELPELWRLAGSLELLEVTRKLDLGASAFRQLEQPKYASTASVLLWSIGRIGSRQPTYGPLNVVLPPEKAAEWIEGLIVTAEISIERMFAVVQLGRRCGDRYRDISDRDRQKASQWLRDCAAPDRYLRLLEGEALERDEEARVFGETLPLGIRLVR